MKILISGASGFVGRALSQKLLAQNHKIFALDRSHPSQIDIKDIDAVIHLAGEPIASGRWTAEKKKKIMDSRMISTRNLMNSIASAPSGFHPKVIITASAIGYYGDRGEEWLNESAPPGDDFLASVCQAWEKESLGVKIPEVRQIAIRTGIVLGQGGGVLRQITVPFAFGLGGPLGSGSQWMSWIHLEDLISLYCDALIHPEFEGPINGVSPNPVRNRDFGATLAKVMKRPALLRIPACVLQIGLGEMSSLLLNSQRVSPHKATHMGFGFQHPNLEETLIDLLRASTHGGL